MKKISEGHSSVWGKNEYFEVNTKLWFNQGSNDIRLYIDGEWYQIPKKYAIYNQLKKMVSEGSDHK